MKQSTSQELSPCVRQCELNKDKICISCYRSIDEIVAWAKKSSEEQKSILARSKQRKLKKRI